MADRAFHKQKTEPHIPTKEKEIPLPASIGPYHIEALFGKGGMSLLYLGSHPENKVPLVIKVLSPAYVTQADAVERFFQEAAMIEMTNHPNIVKLYGQGEWENGLYIAMELIHGISLRQFILQHSLSVRRALEIILQVAYALLHLHAHGVIHRDLKPENILINEEGEIKVIDFGIAQLHEISKKEGRPLGGVLGTPSYMSPEQKENASSVTFSSDIYSLGVILYELISGSLSYGVIHLDILPKGIRKIASKALAISAKERYQNISSLIHDVSEYLSSGVFEKERPGSDAIKEIEEAIQKANLLLSPQTPPKWPQIDVGIAKERGIQQLGLYYDFFHLPNDTFLVLLSGPPTPSIESTVYAAILRGIIHMQLHAYNPTKHGKFQPLKFINALNELFFDEMPGQSFALNLLLLDPFNEQLTYLSCGFNALLHLSYDQPHARLLTGQNPLLGTELSAEFSEISDNWNVGDTLILHSLALPKETPASQKESLDGLLTHLLEDHSLMSPHRQAETLLKQASLSSSWPSLSYPKAVISLQRII